MGSSIEFNDTLKLKRGEEFPSELKVGRRYDFSKEGRRLYHMKPVRVFLVEEREGLWNFVGQVHIVELTIDAINEETRGVFELVKIYPEGYAIQLNQFDAPPGKGWSGE